MSAAITYGQNGTVDFLPSFITDEEAVLLASAKAGDSTAFERLVMPQWDTLLRVTQRILHNREDAEDAVQTAFLDAFRNLHRFEGRARFSSWLTRIAMNAALMHLRSRRRERVTSLEDVTGPGVDRDRCLPADKRQNPEQEYLSKEGQALLQQGLTKLGPRYVEVLELRSAQQLSAKEMARIMKVPVGTIKARLHRARTKLTQHVKAISMRRTYSVGAISSRRAA